MKGLVIGGSEVEAILGALEPGEVYKITLDEAYSATFQHDFQTGTVSRTKRGTGPMFVNQGRKYEIEPDNQLTFYQATVDGVQIRVAALACSMHDRRSKEERDEHIAKIKHVLDNPEEQ